MMFRCYICKSLFATTVKLIRHLKLVHSLYPGKKFELVCAQDGCFLQFKSYAGFKKHLTRFHFRGVASSSGNISIQNQHAPNPDEALVSDTEQMTDNDAQVVECSSLSRDSSREMCASIIAKLQANGVANNLILSVIESMEDFVNDFHTNLRESILNVVPVGSTTRSSVEEVFNNFHNSFSDFNTDTKWRKYFSKKWGVVEPTEIHLGVRYDSRRNTTSGMYEQTTVNDTFIYIPLLKTLEFIFRNEEVCKLIQEHRQSDMYREFCDGQYYKRHPLYSICNNALQIQIYYDDFETANPLGSKQGIHKLGCIYFVLRNLPSHVNSSLMNIHLISLFHSEDGKKYGMDKILGPLIDDVKVLEQKGMKVSFSEEPIFGTIAQITGDNLGLNGILGYVESFSAKHYCRLCLTDKVLAQEVFSEDDPRVILRNRNQNEKHYKYLADNPNENSCYGIKRNSILNTLTYFNVSENFVLDIMHDILEGVAQYEVKLLFEYMSCGLIPCDSIPQRLYAFNYGFLDRNNRPTKVNLQHPGNSIGLNASQTLCLIRNIPLIFGDVVPEGDKHWHLMLLLLQIVDIVFSHCISEGMIIFLKHLIVEHHRLFKDLYPSRNLIPKHHLMIHYPECIRQIGPLIHVWTMRYEAKHRFFKKNLKNFKNLTKSLAKKHQLAIAYYWESCTTRGIESGPVSNELLSDLEKCDFISEQLNIDLSSEVTITPWVKCHGTEYRKNLVVCLDLVEDVPVFGKIVQILIKDGVYFLVSCMESEFVEHLHAFRVFAQEHSLVLKKTEQLFYYKPFDLQMTYGNDSSFYIVLDCYL